MTLRRGAALVALLVLALLMIPAAPAAASGGGGCGRAVTNVSGTEIRIRDYCFIPTVLYADVGATVTWTNKDVVHNVAGANLGWGSFETFRPGRTMSYSFSEPGVYSYVCTLHAGMVGTVVVGDPQPGAPTAADAVRRIKLTSATRSDPVPAPSTSSGSAVWVALAAGLFVAVGAVGVGRRLRKSHGSS